MVVHGPTCRSSISDSRVLTEPKYDEIVLGIDSDDLTV